MPEETRTTLDRAIRLHHAGQIAPAEALYRQVLAQHPTSFEAHTNLGHVLSLRGQSDAAQQHYRRAIAINPRYPIARNNLGGLLLGLGHPDQAIEQFNAALALDSGSVMALNNLGTALRQLGRIDQAIAHHQRALALSPDHVSALNNLALALVARGDLADGIRCYRKAIAAKADYAEAHYNLAGALSRQGEVDEALSCFRTALGLLPRSALFHTGMLLCMHYTDAFTPEEVLSAHQSFDRLLAAPLGPAAGVPVAGGDASFLGRRLRVGYVSADLRRHSVSYFIEPILREHQRHAFEVVCYASVSRPDEVTARLSGLCDAWRDVHKMSDEALAELVRSDRIDILVDLCGHTSDNRLLAFARRPAPIQVTYLGYPGTTGMSAMDYRFTDGWADPEGSTEHLHTETLYRLPHGFLCYQPPADADAPPVGPLPLRAAGRVTFASFNNAPKMTPRVVGVWAAILRAVPESRLLLKTGAYGDAQSQKRVEERFAAHGIPKERLTLLGQVASPREHLAHYHQADIALDTFPYNGTTTTCEALWMGVPVISLEGATHVGRVGVSLLSRVGLEHLIMRTEQDYIEQAVRLSADRDGLSFLRAGLRQRLRDSSLLDPTALVPAIEDAYHHMWQIYSTGQAR